MCLYWNPSMMIKILKSLIHIVAFPHCEIPEASGVCNIIIVTIKTRADRTRQNIYYYTPTFTFELTHSLMQTFARWIQRKCAPCFGFNFPFSHAYNALALIHTTHTHNLLIYCFNFYGHNTKIFQLVYVRSGEIQTGVYLLHTHKN